MHNSNDVAPRNSHGLRLFFSAVGRDACMPPLFHPLCSKEYEIVYALWYIRILESNLLPVLPIHSTTTVQQDSALCHVAKPVKSWLQKKKKIRLFGLASQLA